MDLSVLTNTTPYTPPDDRCGFELERELVIKRGKMVDEYENRLMGLEPEQWYEKFNVSCCWREVWNDSSRCVWHAEVDDKPIQDLVAARSNEPDSATMDGVFLQNSKMGDRISFRCFRLIGADFSGADLKHVDLSGTDLWGPTSPVRISIMPTSRTRSSVSTSRTRISTFQSRGSVPTSRGRASGMRNSWAWISRLPTSRARI